MADCISTHLNVLKLIWDSKKIGYWGIHSIEKQCKVSRMWWWTTWEAIDATYPRSFRLKVKEMVCRVKSSWWAPSKQIAFPIATSLPMAVAVVLCLLATGAIRRGLGFQGPAQASFLCRMRSVSLKKDTTMLMSMSIDWQPRHCKWLPAQCCALRALSTCLSVVWVDLQLLYLRSIKCIVLQNLTPFMQAQNHAWCYRKRCHALTFHTFPLCNQFADTSVFPDWRTRMMGGEVTFLAEVFGLEDCGSFTCPLDPAWLFLGCLPLLTLWPAVRKGNHCLNAI